MPSFPFQRDAGGPVRRGRSAFGWSVCCRPGRITLNGPRPLAMLRHRSRDQVGVVGERTGLQQPLRRSSSSGTELLSPR